MKKFLFPALALGLVMTSCQSDEPFAPGAGEEVQASFTISVPDAMGTRAADHSSAEGGYSNGAGQLNYTVVLLNDANKVMYSATSAGNGTSATFNPTVVQGYTYKILAYATFDNAVVAPTVGQTIADTDAINNIATLKGINDESEDAYFCNDTIKGKAEMAAMLKRPFGKLRLVATDYDKLKALGTDVASVKVTYGTTVVMEEKFDAYNQEFEVNEVNGGGNVWSADKATYAEAAAKELTVFVDYLPAGNGETMYPFEIEVTYKNGKGTYTRTFAQDIPVKRNYLTTLRGDFFTTEAALTLNVEEMFENEEEYGTEGNLYIVDVQNTFDSVIEKIKNDKPEYATITLKADATHVTNAGNGSDALYNAGVAKQVTINGNGHTLTFTGAGVGEFGVKDGLLVLNDLNIVDNSVSYNEGAWELTYLEMASVKATNVNFKDEITLEGEVAEFKDCTFLSNEENVYAAWISSGSVAFEKCHFTGWRGLKMHEDYGSEIKKVVVNECVFENITKKPGIAIGDLNADTEVVITNNEFIMCQAGDQGNYMYETDTDVTTFKFTEKNNDVISKTETIATATQLKDVLTSAGLAGSTVVNITSDIDMTGIAWTPVKINGYNGADIVYVNGNNHKIKGLTAGLFAGGFAGGSGIIINDLTIEDSHIVADNTQGYGAFVGCADSMDKIELNNCHLINSSIITPNDGANESRIGGLIGWTAGYNNQNDGPVDSYINVKNCSVVNCVLKGAGSIGAIVGHAGANAATFTTIENCTVKNCNLTSTDDGGWRVGVVVGTANNGQCVINNITESGNVLSQTGKTAPAGQSNLYGRFVPAGTGSLVIDGIAIN